MGLFDWLVGKKKAQNTPSVQSPDGTNEKPELRARISTQDRPTGKSAVHNAATRPNADLQMTRVMTSRNFPKELTNGHSREQVADLIRASARYMWTGIGNWIGETFSDPSTSGIDDPAAASMAFQMSIPTSEEQGAIQAVHRNWEFLISSIRKHGGLDGFCDEYHKVTSTRTHFNPHKPICDKCARDLNPSPVLRAGDHYSGYICKPCKTVVCARCASEYNCPDCGSKLDDAGVNALLDLASAKQASAQGQHR